MQSAVLLAHVKKALAQTRTPSNIKMMDNLSIQKPVAIQRTIE